tara:strand:- start:4104 stop:4655 length:552 start_codon:yes stop_codon:yes gene_type:complete
MDEFAEFEMELNRDSSSIGAEDIIAEIEEMDEIPDYVFHREEKLYTAQFKKAFLFLGILLLPLFGIGAVLIWMSAGNGPLNQDTIVVKSRAYVKKYSCLVEYELHDGSAKMVKIFPIFESSFLSLRTTYGGDHDSITNYTYNLHSGDEIFWLLSYSGRMSKHTRSRIVKISEFAILAGLRFKQ